MDYDPSGNENFLFHINFKFIVSYDFYYIFPYAVHAKLWQINLFITSL